MLCKHNAFLQNCTIHKEKKEKKKELLYKHEVETLLLLL